MRKIVFILGVTIGSVSMARDSYDVQSDINALVSKRNMTTLCKAVDKTSRAYSNICQKLKNLERELERVSARESKEKNQAEAKWKVESVQILAAVQKSPAILAILKSQNVDISSLSLPSCTPPESTGLRSCEIFASLLRRNKNDDAKNESKEPKPKRVPADEGDVICDAILFRFKVNKNLELDESSVEHGIFGSCEGPA